MFPDTVNCLETVSVQVMAPVPSVSERQTPEAPLAVRLGWFVPVKLASPMMASTVAVGTPAVQFVAVPQVVLLVPFHDEVVANAETLVSIRIAVKKDVLVVMAIPFFGNIF